MRSSISELSLLGNEANQHQKRGIRQGRSENCEEMLGGKVAGTKKRKKKKSMHGLLYNFYNFVRTKYFLPHLSTNSPTSGCSSRPLHAINETIELC